MIPVKLKESMSLSMPSICKENRKKADSKYSFARDINQRFKHSKEHSVVLATGEMVMLKSRIGLG
jgi:hypothetical protein